MEVSGWCPLGPNHTLSDDAIFEALTAAVFQARFRPAIVQSRWPAIRQAFADFHLTTVAAWPDERLTMLLAAPGMIRNPKKIRATLRNARELAALRQRHGSLLAYLQSLGPAAERLVGAVDAWAHYVGAPSIRWWLRCLGLIPPAQAA
jgi:DNA-3-methyladenine glycosylase I